MIKLTANSVVHSISPVLQITDSFQKRELVLNDSWERDGQVFANYVVIEFTGDRMALLDSFATGQRVTVEAAVNGREHNGRIFNTIRGLSIAPYHPQQVATMAPQYQAPQAPQYPQQTAAAPQPAYQQQQVWQQQPAYQQQPQYPQGPATPNAQR